VVIQEVTKELADSFGLAKPAGAIVNAVEPGGPAEKAGVEAGDVILRFDGKAVGASSDLPRLVGATRPGSRVSLQVWRKGAARDLTLTVAEMPADDKADGKAAKKGKAVEPQVNRLGLVVSELSAEQRRELKVAGGLLVEDVRGAAARSELRPGDVILALISKGVTSELRSTEQFNRLLAQFDKGANVTLLIRRGDMQTFVTVKGLNGGN